MLHVADAVYEDQQADEGDHHQHDCGERVEHPADLEPLIAKLEPADIRKLNAIAGVFGEYVREGAERK
jgi:hypothetical protein